MDDVQQQITGIKNILPKFAIPMREVGDRFQGIYFAAKGTCKKAIYAGGFKEFEKRMYCGYQ